MEKIIFLEELFFEKMWGNENLEKFYQDRYEKKILPLGEVWGLSGHKNGVNKIKSGAHVGKDLNWLWENKPEYFGRSAENNTPNFPIQIRLVDALKKLSVQVHPDDAYAHEHADDNGKNECWYILKSAKDADIIYGHTAKTKAELQTSLEENKLETLMNHMPVKAGDFVYVPTGMIHAIGDEIFLIEVAECSDTTYRFYDYNRKDQEGNTRPLHLQESFDVVQVPEVYQTSEMKKWTIPNGYHECYIDNEIFTVEYLNVEMMSIVTKRNPYYGCYVISGTGKVDGVAVKTGDFFLITNELKTFKTEGKLEIFIAYKR